MYAVNSSLVIPRLIEFKVFWVINEEVVVQDTIAITSGAKKKSPNSFFITLSSIRYFPDDLMAVQSLVQLFQISLILHPIISSQNLAQVPGFVPMKPTRGRALRDAAPFSR
jgi:hypothetical protein